MNIPGKEVYGGLIFPFFRTNDCHPQCFVVVLVLLYGHRCTLKQQQPPFTYSSAFKICLIFSSHDSHSCCEHPMAIPVHTNDHYILHKVIYLLTRRNNRTT